MALLLGLTRVRDLDAESRPVQESPRFSDLYHAWFGLRIGGWLLNFAASVRQCARQAGELMEVLVQLS
jgi:hypothetical protein